MSSKRKSVDTSSTNAPTKRAARLGEDAPLRIVMTTYVEPIRTSGVPVGSFIRINKDTYVRPVQTDGAMTTINHYMRGGRRYMTVVGDEVAAKAHFLAELPEYDPESPEYDPESPDMVSQLSPNSNKATKAAYPYVVEIDVSVVVCLGGNMYLSGYI